MQSMTGFAIKTILLKRDKIQAPVTLSIKSLNSRYLDIICKLPLPLQSIETDLIRIFKKKLHRGNILFSIQVSASGLLQGSLKPDHNLIKNYLAAIQSIKTEYHFTDSISLSKFIQLPNIFMSEDLTFDDEMRAVLFKAVDELIQQLLLERNREGSELLADLSQRSKIIAHEIAAVEKQFQIIMEQRKQNVIVQTNALTNLSNEAKEEHRAKLFLELDRIDIHEEIIRFKNHLNNFNHQLTLPEPEKGRRLDFILQELNREVNTIAAKCADAIISAHAINIKVELEKAREQVQNIV